jgi:ABC-type transport system substrate-binding protein
MSVHGFYPDLPGWDPTGEQRVPELYGDDLAAAKRLRADAGYPKGCKAKAGLLPLAAAPELIPLMEAVHIQLREVGIALELEEADWAAVVRPTFRDRQAHGYLYAIDQQGWRKQDRMSPCTSRRVTDLYGWSERSSYLIS